jgi:ubiquitin-protein ligase
MSHVLFSFFFCIQVLQPRSQWVPAGKLENIINELSIDDISEIQKEDINDTKNQETSDQADTDTHNMENHRSVSVIVQELQKELERSVMEVIRYFLISFFSYVILISLI